MPLRARLLHALGQASRRGAARRFQRAAKDPQATQDTYLKAILQQNSGTEYGKALGFSGIATGSEYAAKVPLMEPLELQPWVRRMMDGESNLLSFERPIYYVMTSGSTADPKYIPITPTYRRELQATVHGSVWHLYRKFPEAFVGKALYFVGSRRVAVAKDGCDIGTMSGFNFTELPRMVRALYAWPYELFEVKHHATRNTLALLLACVGRPSLIAGVFPAPIVYLLRELAERSAELASVLRRGTLPQELELSPAQRAFFEAKLGGVQPEIAKRLERAAKAPVEEKVREVWPELRLVYCWTSATAGLFVPELKRRLGPEVAVRDAIYSACEGWNNIPMGDESPGGALATHVHYFEFIEEAAYERGGRAAVNVEGLREGGRYYIVLTTGAGLYRYVLGDVVEVYGFFEKTPLIRFVRKGGATANLLGEKLDEAHINHAMALALKQFAIEATYFTLAPAVPGDKPGYALYLELPGAADPALAERVAQACDEGLRGAGYDYDRLRKSGQLLPVRAIQLPPGTYDRVRQRKVEAGSAEAQLKTAHLQSDRAALAPELLEAEARVPKGN
jgi:hypothetical protein